MLKSLLKPLFALCIVWPVMRLWLGLRIHQHHNLPKQGPAILVANHNSHMDVFALMSLYSPIQQRQIHPAAAADYFLSNKWMAWFALNVLNIIPVTRQNNGQGNPLQGCEEALRKNKILILFPEGSRGEPGKMQPLKSGLWYLSATMPDVPIIPVWLQGTEQIMAKGNRIPLPLFIDVNIGKPMYYQPDKEQFKTNLLNHLLALRPQYRKKNFND